MENEITQLKVNMKEIQTDIGYIKESLVQNFTQHKEIIGKIDHLSDTFQTRIEDKADKKDIEGKYVSTESFAPVQRITYGLVGAVLLAALYAILNLVIK